MFSYPFLSSILFSLELMHPCISISCMDYFVSLQAAWIRPSRPCVKKLPALSAYYMAVPRNAHTWVRSTLFSVFVLFYNPIHAPADQITLKAYIAILARSINTTHPQGRITYYLYTKSDRTLCRQCTFLINLG